MLANKINMIFRTPGQKTILTADGANLPMKTSSPVTKRAWTSSGSETKAWPTWTTSLIRIVLAEEIIENLEVGVESFKQIMESINGQ